MNTETVFSRFKEVALRRGDAPFVSVLDSVAKVYDIEPGDVSYAEMLEKVIHWSTKFEQAGYQRGQRVAVLLENRPVYLEIWFALNNLGLSIVPINPDLRLSELEYLISHSESVLVIGLKSRTDELKEAVRMSGLSTPVVDIESDLPLAPKKQALKNEVENSTECALLYTSGTTGRPKGCVLSNEYFLNCGDWYVNQKGLISLRKDQERMLTPLPLFHMNAMAASVMSMVTVGGCLIMLDRFHPRSWWESVAESRASIVHYLGVMPSMLMGMEAVEAEKNLKVRFGFGAGVDRELHAKFEERFGFPLLEAWACTETGNGACICANEEPRKIGTSCFGRPSDELETRIVDDQGNDVDKGVPGELLVRRRGENPRYGFFTGYLKDEAATAAVWEGGWFHTGDVVSQDDDGAMHFVDRRKNVIRRSGENIAAVEVESIYNRHPDIRMMGVVAIPDAVRGDEVGAFIILEDGKAGQEKAIELVKWGLDQMAYYKVPGWLKFVDELPVTSTQKIVRGKLKDLSASAIENGEFIDTRALKKRQK